MIQRKRLTLEELAEIRRRDLKGQAHSDKTLNYLEGKVIWNMQGKQAVRVESEQKNYLVEPKAAFLAQDKNGKWVLLNTFWASPSALCLEFPDGAPIDEGVTVRIPYERSVSPYVEKVSSKGLPWWEVLGIPQGSNLELIKSTFRRLAKEHHPDTCKQNDTSMYQLNQAMREAETEYFNKYKPSEDK